MFGVGFGFLRFQAFQLTLNALHFLAQSGNTGDFTFDLLNLAFATDDLQLRIAGFFFGARFELVVHAEPQNISQNLFAFGGLACRKFISPPLQNKSGIDEGIVGDFEQFFDFVLGLAQFRAADIDPRGPIVQLEFQLACSAPFHVPYADDAVALPIQFKRERHAHIGLPARDQIVI